MVISIYYNLVYNNSNIILIPKKNVLYFIMLKTTVIETKR